MLFMGQEFLEDKPWSDTPDPATLICWDGLETDDVMRDYLRFTPGTSVAPPTHPALAAKPSTSSTSTTATA